MKVLRGAYIIKIIAVIMAICFSVPCSLKRELKSALQLPITSNKSNTPIACHSFIETQTNARVVTHRYQFRKNKIESKIFHNSFYTFPSLQLRATQWNISAIPLYQLHQHYLI